jgi:hypothetical protein
MANPFPPGWGAIRGLHLVSPNTRHNEHGFNWTCARLPICIYIYTYTYTYIYTYDICLQVYNGPTCPQMKPIFSPRCFAPMYNQWDTIQGLGSRSTWYDLKIYISAGHLIAYIYIKHVIDIPIQSISAKSKIWVDIYISTTTHSQFCYFMQNTVMLTLD